MITQLPKKFVWSPEKALVLFDECNLHRSEHTGMYASASGGCGRLDDQYRAGLDRDAFDSLDRFQ